MRDLLLASLICFLTSQCVCSSIQLVRNGKSNYSLVLSKDASPSEHFAAAEFKHYIYQISGAIITYAPDSTNPPQKAILIGDSDALRSLGAVPEEFLQDESFVIRTAGERLVIAGGRLRGTMYGVYTFLEEVLGCRWLSGSVEKIPKMSTINVPDIEIAQKPAFEYRDVFIREAMNKTYAAKHKLNSANAGLDSARGGAIAYYPFVHTFAALVPVEKYWDTHPEYFSMVNGKRIKDHTQLCLTNPDVLKIAIETVLNWIREHPEAKLYSVSQNDWYNNCQCERCKAIEEEEGSPAGLVLRFCNAIAEEVEKCYPDKLIDTLAYQWTEKPPKITRPRHNVRVRLCPIFCCEAHPYESCDAPENKAFLENLKGWASITDQLYIWHYNTSFAHYLNPFPDFRQLVASARLYKKMGVKGIFWEGSYSPGGGGEMAYLRAYLLSKLSWDPDVDADKIMQDFCNDYYSKAGEYIWQYVQLLLDKVTKANIHVKIWASPTDAFLTPEIISEADHLFDKAESVAESPEILDRVKQARLSLEYVKLMQPIMRNEFKGQEEKLAEALDTFVAKCKSYGMTHISEGETLDSFHARVRKQLVGG
ncbi:MAG: DUF4838 domain-containing protein [Armatimonadota bacterium]